MNKKDIIEKYEKVISELKNKMLEMNVKEAVLLSTKISCYKSFINDLQK